MTTAQNYTATGMATVKKWTPTVPLDVNREMGVECVQVQGAPLQMRATQALITIQRIMQDIRATGKCGMFVARWDGQAWCFHVCDPPARVNET